MYRCITDMPPHCIAATKISHEMKITFLGTIAKKHQNKVAELK